MVRISITTAAYEAIVATLPFGSIDFEGEADAQGERQIGLEPRVLDRLKAMRGRARATAMSSCGWPIQIRLRSGPSVCIRERALETEYARQDFHRHGHGRDRAVAGHVRSSVG